MSQEAIPAGFAPGISAWLRARQGPMTAELAQVHREGWGNLPRRLEAERTSRAICGFCSTGCSLTVHQQGDRAVNITPDPDYPVNLGMACPKGWEALAPLTSEERAVTPWLRDGTGRMQPVGWEQAAAVFCERFKAIQRRHGPHSVAWLGTGQMMVEELAYLGALGKFGMGLQHGDGNTRQCMATAVAAYKESFGYDAPPFTYGDLEASDVLVFVGANPCLAHPILWQRVLRNRNRPEIVVIDPRRTETAAQASQHLALKPKSDLTLFYGLAALLIRNGWIDPDYIGRHTSGFEAFAAFVRGFTVDKVAVETGLEAARLERLAETIGLGKAVSFWWTMGVNQGHQATRTAQAIINLALMTGNMGRPGTGANSITGQCNAMGSRLYSNTTNLLGGHDFANPVHREKIAGLLGIPENRIPREPSLAYDQILEGVKEGTIRGLWIVATNPAHSWIERGGLGEVLRRLDFLVVQDMYATTETARAADLLLPAAGWGEKEGTFINSERRLGVCRKVARPPGQALSDFQIFRLLAEAWGCGKMFAQWNSPEAVFQWLKRCSRGLPSDITGIDDYAMIERCGGVQWPWIKGQGSQPPAERRLFEDGAFHTPDQRARFVFQSPVRPAEVPDARYPLWLLTGRGTSAQWHTNTRTRQSGILRQMYPERAYVEIHPEDARTWGVTSQELVWVGSRRGRVRVTAVVTPDVGPGSVFMPMHYEETNLLTLAQFDPCSRQPSYKAGAVSLEPAAASPLN